MDFIPKVGLEFDSEEMLINSTIAMDLELDLLLEFGREYINKNKKTGQITSRKFTCTGEGFRVPHKRVL
jgi:hypothetical protein